MGNTIERKQVEGLSSSLNKYINNYLAAYGQIMGISSHSTWNDHYPEAFGNELVGNLSKFSEDVQGRIVSASFGVRVSKPTGATFVEQEALNMLKVWQQQGIFEQLLTLSSDTNFDLPKLERSGYNIVIPRKDNSKINVLLKVNIDE